MARATAARRQRTAESFAVRPARVADLSALLDIERRSFKTDRLSRRSFHHLLTRAHAICLAAERDGQVVGDAIVLLHRGNSLARLYSIAVDAGARGAGIGAALLAEAERRAVEAGGAFMRLEVRPDAKAAVALYRRAGYREIGHWPDYYEDRTEALRMEKPLAGGDRPELRRVPYYPQSLDFTCGPACLIMAMKAVDPRTAVDRRLELRLWREATTIFMTSGHGGCGPFGLALAAHDRGFDVEILVSNEAGLFLDSVRSEQKKQVMRLVQEEFRDAVRDAGIPVTRRAVGARDFVAMLRAGAVPIVLVSTYRFYGQKVPHWVVLTGFDKRFLYLHDPYVDFETERTSTDCMNIPVTHEEFERVARYGRARQRAAVLITGRRKS